MRRAVLPMIMAAIGAAQTQAHAHDLAGRIVECVTVDQFPAFRGPQIVTYAFLGTEQVEITVQLGRLDCARNGGIGVFTLGERTQYNINCTGLGLDAEGREVAVEYRGVGNLELTVESGVIAAHDQASSDRLIDGARSGGAFESWAEIRCADETCRGGYGFQTSERQGFFAVECAVLRPAGV